MKKRAKVVEGTQEVNIEEIKEQLKNISLNDKETTNTEKGIPNFWLKCFQNSNQFGSLINKKDEKVLSTLKDVTCDYKENGNFTLHFLFEANDYFNQTELNREFILNNKLEITKINSTKIEWKSEDVNPTIEKKKKKY